MTDQAPLDQLVDLLDLESVEVDIFRGKQPQEDRQRVFGGQVAGQALVAAGRTVPDDRPVHSLHAYFLRPGDPSIPIVYEVDRIRDGKSFTTRRVVAIQHGRPIFHLSASFQVVEQGLEHQAPMPDVPDPDDLPPVAQQLKEHFKVQGDDSVFDRPQAIDIRYVTEPPLIRMEGEKHDPRSQVWMRANGTLPDDPLLHVCAVTFASDMLLLDSPLMRHGLILGKTGIQLASLDHAMWFHQQFRADEWFLYSTDSARTGGARGLAHGEMFTRDGQLAVTVMQEGLMREH